MNQKSLSKVVIITGSGRGIGKAAALMFGQRGYKVVILARTRNEIKETGEEVRKFGGPDTSGLVMQTDVRKLTDIRKLVAATLKKWGRIDILINNAAVAYCGSFDEQTASQQQEMVETNVRGLVDFIREVRPVMAKQGSGIIVNVASRAGHAGRQRYSVYSATKAAVINITSGLAPGFVEEGIKMFCLCPKGTATKMFFDCNPGAIPDDQPEDVAKVMVEMVEQPDRYTIGDHFDL